MDKKIAEDSISPSTNETIEIVDDEPSNEQSQEFLMEGIEMQSVGSIETTPQKFSEEKNNVSVPGMRLKQNNFVS